MKLLSNNYLDPEMEMNVLHEKLSEFNEDKMLYALVVCGFNPCKVETTTSYINENYQKLNRTYIFLKERSVDFCKLFFTDYNSCYSTSMRLLKDLRSGIKPVLKLCHDFCPRLTRGMRRRIMLYMKEKPNIYSHSSLTTTFNYSLFGIENFPDCVKELHEAMSKFFSLLLDCIQLCKDILKEEESVRNNDDLRYYYYCKFRDEFIATCRSIFSAIDINSEVFSDENNPLWVERNSCVSELAWTKGAYHNGTKAEGERFVIMSARKAAEFDGYTFEERHLFNNDKLLIEKARCAIDNFDTLVEYSSKKGKLSALDVAVLARCLKVKDGDMNKFVIYFNKRYDGIYAKVKSGAVYGSKNSKDWKKDEKEEVMMMKLNRLFDEKLQIVNSTLQKEKYYKTNAQFSTNYAFS